MERIEAAADIDGCRPAVTSLDDGRRQTGELTLICKKERTQRSPRTRSPAEADDSRQPGRMLNADEVSMSSPQREYLRVAPRPRRPLRTFLLSDQG